MGPSDRNVLEVQGLTVRFDTSERSVVAVKDLGFHVRAGEVLAIVGESGSGKSLDFQDVSVTRPHSLLQFPT